MEDVQRFLELVRRELGAEDARIEFGAASLPSVHVTLDSGFVVSALFDGDAPDDSTERLERLVDAFHTTLESVAAPSFRSSRPRGALDDALGVLAGHAHADAAWVFDEHSPALWGSSFEPRGNEDMSTALALVALERSLGDADLASALTGAVELQAGLRQRVEEMRRIAPERSEAEWRRRLIAYRCADDVRQRLGEAGRTRHVSHETGAPYLARCFGGVYRLVLIFGEPGFSELHAEAAMIHALPWIEKLTGALPPVDPDGGGKVVKMRRLRPV